MSLNILLVTLLLIVIVRNIHDKENARKYNNLLRVYNGLLNTIARRPDFD